MLSIGQKLVAFTTILVLNAIIFALSPVFGILAIFGSLPMTFAIYNQ